MMFQRPYRSKLAHRLRMMQNFLKVPAGLILPYTDTTAPAGWSMWDTASDNYLMGASSTRSVTGTGGVSSISHSVSGTSSAGNHTGSGGYTARIDCCTGGYSEWNTYDSDGAHSHTTGTMSSGTQPLPIYRDYRFIQADTAGPIPAGARLMGVADLSTYGLSNVDTHGRLIRSCTGTPGSDGGNNSLSWNGSGTTGSSTGSHNHLSTLSSTEYPPSITNLSTTGGASHSHSWSGSASMTWNIQRYIVTMWTNATALFSIVPGGIGIWLSDTPPDGWSICDGTNGTPDMRDCYVEVGTTSTHNAKTGSLSHTISWSLNAATASWTHNHNTTGSLQSNKSGGYHSSQNKSHSHPRSGNSGVTDIPKYYSVHFVQYTG